MTSQRTKEIVERLRQSELALSNILGLFPQNPFGEKAKSEFLKLCRKYYDERKRMEHDEIAGQSTQNPRRAKFHGQIMTTFALLRTIPDAKQKCPAYSRGKVGNAVMEWFENGGSVDSS